MRLMAIDYGAKRVGVASTDDSGSFALPRTILMNSGRLVEDLIELAGKYQAARIVVGESKNLDNTPNPVNAEIEKLVEDLRARGLEVVLHPEVFTSAEAARLQGAGEMLDASAAAIILKSYIDTHAS